MFYSATNWANGTTIGNIADVDTVVYLQSLVVGTNNLTYVDFASDPNKVYGDATVDMSTGNIAVRRLGIFASSKPSSIIVEYTKTTD